MGCRDRTRIPATFRPPADGGAPSLDWVKKQYGFCFVFYSGSETA